MAKHRFDEVKGNGRNYVVVRLGGAWYREWRDGRISPAMSASVARCPR